VKRCLAKDQDNRWQTARDLRHELQWIKDGSGQTGIPVPVAAKPAAKPWRHALALASAALVAAVIAGIAVWSLRPALPQPVSRLAITLPPGQRLAALDQPAIAISPDGKNLVYVAIPSRDGTSRPAVDREGADNPSRPSGPDGPSGPRGDPERSRRGAVPTGFAAGKPRMLFEGPYLPTPASFPYYDVSPDGQRFLMLKPAESQASAPTQINVVLNWFEELKRKVPVP